MLFKAIEKMKISIVGTGMIATEVITLLKTEVKGIDITSIYSHSNEEKAEYLAKMNHIERIYTDYAQLLKEDKADFVYIALVNSVHYEFTRKALEAGRNVIIEKPFTLTVAEAEELSAMARERKLYLFEAISPLHTPNFHMVKESLKKIGPVHFVQCNFSQYSSKYDRYLQGDIAPAFNPDLGGGALKTSCLQYQCRHRSLRTTYRNTILCQPWSQWYRHLWRNGTFLSHNDSNLYGCKGFK